MKFKSQGDEKMTLFQAVLQELCRSKGPLYFDNIATAIGKSKMSVKGEIGRLKKTSWIGRWLRVNWKKEEVTLAQNLRGCRLDTLEFLVKQFYNHDKLTKKGLFNPDGKIDINEADKDFEKQIKSGKQFDFSNIDIITTGAPEKKPKEDPIFDNTKVKVSDKTYSFEDINFDDLGCGNKSAQNA
jgi:hypothetical protein